MNHSIDIDHVLTSCNSNIRWFRRLVNRPGLSRRWRRTVYYAIVRSKLTYGNTALCNMSKQQFRRLDVVQNNCLRAILNVRIRDRVSIAELQSRCRIPSLTFFTTKCQKRYIKNAVRNILPIREDVESVRNGHSLNGPIVKLAKHLGDDPLPSML